MAVEDVAQRMVRIVGALEAAKVPFALAGGQAVRYLFLANAAPHIQMKALDQIEPRTPAVNIGMVDYDVPFMVRGSIFVDYGQLYLADPSAGTAFQEFLGAGFAVSATVGNNFEGRLTVAAPLIDGPHQEAGNFHFYFSLAAQF
jgi:hypothetical protein